MINFEVTQFHNNLRHQKLKYPNIDFNINCQFYYDETNNPRKFYLKEEGFNHDFTSNFILGGVMHENNPPDLKALFKSFNLQKSASEVKFKNIASGNFKDCLKSKKLSLFLKFMLGSNLFVHYSSLNFLYWSVVDIVDSALYNSPDEMKLNEKLALTLKNDLYQIVKQKIESFGKLFFNYGYPNIIKQELSNFIRDFILLLHSYEGDIKYQGSIQLLIILLQTSDRKELVFIMNEKDHLLLPNLLIFYISPLYTFLNSTHTFDNEEEIKKELSKYNFTYNGKPFRNYNFIDSKNSDLVQLSDIFVGILGKYIDYRNKNIIEDIFNDIDDFSDLQRENLIDFIQLIIRSESKNYGLIVNQDGPEEMLKLDQIIYYLHL